MVNKIIERNILITSPEGYADRLTKAFEECSQMAHFHPISIPMIHTNVYTLSDDFQNLMKQLNEYDYLAFSSRKAIEAFAIGLKETGAILPTSIQMCAIGKDNEFLKESLHVEPAFISSEPSPRGIVKHLQGIAETKGRRIAVLTPQVIGMEEPSIVPNFITGLEEIGMHPVRITAYQTKAASKETIKETSKKILNNEFDAVIFTSGTEIKVFLELIPENMSVDTFLQDLTVICYGPYTASCAKKYGVKVNFTSQAFGSFQELVEQISFYYNNI